MNKSPTKKSLAKKDLKKAELDALFKKRLEDKLDLIQLCYFRLYPEAKHKKSFDALRDHLHSLFSSRPRELQLRDLEKVKGDSWYHSEKIVGMQLYVDHFNNDLSGLLDRLDYFENLGVNFLHLMPLMKRPKGENDGGYAVNSYTEVDPRYGSNEDLLLLTEALRARGIYLMLDFVINHTSNEFPWAKKAASGTKKYQDYYYTFPDREIPDAFEETLPEVFPVTAPGNFTYVEKMDRWVMTVFNTYQWDLNYTNPEVFQAMLTELVKLANLGVDMVRFDALAFLWKKIGTISQNLPEAHTLISLFKLCLQVVSPGVAVLAEAIVAPRDVLKYFGEGPLEGNECDLAYNATLMALIWNSVATKKTNLLYRNINGLPPKPESCAWINYIRCHDDIGLGFDDRYIYELGWDAGAHRSFLLDYFARNFPGSPSKGQVFMYNEKTGDGRITGSAASLLGLEKALEEKDPKAVSAAIDRIVMLHGIILSYGGAPMIYSGDEWGALNDYSYLDNPVRKSDSRWLNRPKQNWKIIENLNDDSPSSEIYHRISELIDLRKKTKPFRDGKPAKLIDLHNEHLLAYEKEAEGSSVLVIANFDDHPHSLRQSILSDLGYVSADKIHDLVSGKKISMINGLCGIAPGELLWLKKP